MASTINRNMFLGLFSVVILTVSALPDKVDLKDPVVDKKDYMEGSNVTVVCNVTVGPTDVLFWRNNKGLFQEGKVLSIMNVTRNYTDVYTCVYFNLSSAEVEKKSLSIVGLEIYSFSLNVLYPAELVIINGSKETLEENETFWLYVHVMGNPDPVTTLARLNGREFFHAVGEEFYNITVPFLNCTDTGQYKLSCGNTYRNITRMQNISVLCAPQPDPDFPTNATVTPRIRDNVNITVHAIGYPPPSYQWYHDGTQLFNHTDIGYTTELLLHNISVQYFGDYFLVMRNEIGNHSIPFGIKADGPPDPVTDLKVSDIGVITANLSFISGYDYNRTQTFVVQREEQGKFIDFRQLPDKPKDFGGEAISMLITELEEATAYNLTIVSRNSRGDSLHSGEFVSFTTSADKPTPDPNHPPRVLYTPRLGDNVSLSIIALGRPQFYWTHNGTHINSKNNDTSSEIAIENVRVEDFGEYFLNMTNKVGSLVIKYMLKADGSPQAASHLQVTNVSLSATDVRFITGFNYNTTQTFLIMADNDSHPYELASCKDRTSGRGGDPFSCHVGKLLEDTVYNITVISQNKNGYSEPSDGIVFTTYGKPGPDPAKPVNYTFKPRLDDSVNLTIHAIGYPPPKYEWRHNGKIVKSSDTTYTSTVYIDHMTVANFGDYILNMTNEVGNNTHLYQILASGPPQPVSQVDVWNVGTNRADVNFTSGYNYNDTQTFIILAYNDNKLQVLTSCNDTTSGHGGVSLTCSAENLTEDTFYNVTVVSRNSHGDSKPSDSVVFTTYEVPKPDPSKHTNDTFRPRLADSFNITINAVGNPTPKYEWWFDGKRLESIDANFTSTVTVRSMSVEKFGNYMVNMTNKVGNSVKVYQVLADGPPDPATDLGCGDTTEDSVLLTWQPGFDYGYKQTFKIINIVNNGDSDVLETVSDTTRGGTREENQTYTLSGLDSSRTYTVYILATNAKGDAVGYSNKVTFTTKEDSSDTAEIVGYVVGGLGFIVLVLVIISMVRFYRTRRQAQLYERMREREEEQRPQPAVHHYRYDDAAGP